MQTNSLDAITANVMIAKSLQTIQENIAAVNDHMEAIASSAKEQATGLSEVNSAVNQMDQVTQQNAAMVEETNAASAALAQETKRLRGLVEGFQLGSSSGGKGQRHLNLITGSERTMASPARKLMGRLAGAAGATIKASSAGWDEF